MARRKRTDTAEKRTAALRLQLTPTERDELEKAAEQEALA